jgi:hypothetical protein
MVAAGGCAQVANIHDNQPEALSPAPLAIDQAMQARIWDRTVAYYENGSVVAGRTLYPYRPADNLPYWAYPPLEAGLFYGQTLAMPVTAFLEPDPAVYSGAIVGPTYNAVPPIQTVR